MRLHYEFGVLVMLALLGLAVPCLAGGSGPSSARKGRNVGQSAGNLRGLVHLHGMPRYFFHLRNSDNVDDLQGEELLDDKAMRIRAKAYAIDMAAANVLESQSLNCRHRIEVTNEAGEIVLTLKFGDVVSVQA
jgi:hypothetical protein